MSPFLKIGITRASFHRLGNEFVCKDKLKSLHKGVAIDPLVFFNILWLIPSGTDALFSLRLLKMSETSGGLISIFAKEESILLVNSGRLEFVSSIEEMEQKKSLSVFTLSESVNAYESLGV